MSRTVSELAFARRLLLIALALVVSGSSALAQTVTASWDRNTDTNTAGYRLYYGTASGSYTTSVDVGNQISHQLTLGAGQTYYFVVRGYNVASELGPPSNEASVSLAPPTTPPTAQITASLGPNGTALVAWQTTNATGVTINGAAVAASGSTQYPVSATTTYTIVATGPGGTATASATVVVPRVDCVMSAWTFQSATAWSACTGGQRTRSETWTRTILTPPSGGGAACGPTQEVRVVSQPCTMPPTAQITAVRGTTPGTAVVTWQTTNASAAAINGASVALSGSRTYTIAATTTFTLVATGAGGSATASATVTVPVDCVVSDWAFQSATPWGACVGGQQTRVETWTRSVLTPPSGGGAACGPLQEERVASQACSAPAPVLPGAPSSFASRVSGSTVTLSWGIPASGGAPAGYRVWVGTAAGASNIVSGVDVGNTLRAAGNLPRGTYYARVAAYNGVGEGPTAPEIRFRVGASYRPGRPIGFTASLQDAMAVLSWQAPAGDDADSPTGYVIEAGSAPGLADLARVPVGLASTFQSAVAPGTYYVRVRAVNELGLGDASNEIVLRHGTDLRAPANLAASGGGAMVVLSWHAPSGGSVPAGYLVEAGSAPGRADLAVLRVGDTLRFTTTAPPGLYYVRVRAVAADGTAGEASNEIVVRR